MLKISIHSVRGPVIKRLQGLAQSIEQVKGLMQPTETS